MATRELENTIFDAKRLIGRTFDDPKIVEARKNWPFQVVEGDNNRPMIKIKGKDKFFHPEEIQAKVLERVKQSATNFAAMEVRNCVITVPAYFNDS